MGEAKRRAAYRALEQERIAYEKRSDAAKKAAATRKAKKDAHNAST